MKRLIAVAVALAVGVIALQVTRSDAETGTDSRVAAEQTDSRVAAEQKVTDPVPLLELRTSGNAGWFWTLSHREAALARSQHGMTLRSTRLGYLRRQAFNGSQPLYRLRHTSRTTYLLTGSASERDTLVASGRFRAEGEVGHVWKTQAAGTSPLWRMYKDGLWRVVPNSRKAAYVAAGYTNAKSLGYVYPTYHRAGAIYFGTWDLQGNQAMLDNAQRVYGRRDPWAGVRDFAGDGVPRNRWHWSNESFSDLRPSIGYYDDSSPLTLQKHVAQASGAGLDHFAFYWYWNPAIGAEQYVAGLRAYLAAANRANLDFTIMPCIHPWSDGPVSLRMPRDQIDKAASLIVTEYLSQPNFLRANDGRKVLQVCDTRGIGSGTGSSNDVTAVRMFTDAIKSKARTLLNEEVMITANADIGIDLSAAGFSGRQCQGQWDSTRSYRHYVDNQRGYFAGKSGALIRCVTSGFDERPRIGIMIPDPSPPTQENLKARFRWYGDQSLSEFSRLLGLVRADIAASTRPQTVDNMVLVYAWNEWHEGGFVEPNKRDGCAYLNAIRSKLSLRSGAGCVADPIV
ncbi:MAG: glycoside hydrolase family 99-like domain-containing protein [Micromonosporaceae bacterium]